jgi:hypothetical protein
MVQSGTLSLAWIHSTRSTPLPPIVAVWRLRQVARSQVPFLPSFPHVSVTRLSTKSTIHTHCGPGAGQQHTTNPGARFPTQCLPLVNRLATSATRATKYTCTCCSPFLHLSFPAISLPYCISRIGVYLHRLLKYNLLES